MIEQESKKKKKTVSTQLSWMLGVMILNYIFSHFGKKKASNKICLWKELSIGCKTQRIQNSYYVCPSVKDDNKVAISAAHKQ